MTDRIYNFSAGPATLPESVLREAQENLLAIGDFGVGILEISHRSPQYTEINAQAQARIKSLLGAGDEWEVLFLQGGASTQFAMVPMNLGADGDYAITGTWSQKAIEEAQKLGNPRVIASSEGTSFDRIPALGNDWNANASFFHFTSNNTVAGTQWREAPAGVPVPVVCDASSDILSRPLDLARYGLIYAGAQKNLGPAGVTLVMIRKALLERSPESLPTMLRYVTHAKKASLYNTPPVFAVYVVGLVAKWLEAEGGLAAAEERNERKAATLYEVIDEVGLYRGVVANAESRSRMNVTFRLTDESLEPEFVAAAAAVGLHGLKGHRSVGGCRASLYNAMPERGVESLAAFMRAFAAGR